MFFSRSVKLIVLFIVFNLSACDGKFSVNNNQKLKVDIFRLTNDDPKVNNPQNIVGTVTFEDTEFGLLIKPNLANITPGPHGFHIHQNPDCSPKNKDGKQVLGLAAGGHYAPKYNFHKGPFVIDGHLGDLPFLFADENGRANMTILAPKLKLSDLKNRSVVIHKGGDNYSDDPKPLGGGGARDYCGVIN